MAPLQQRVLLVQSESEVTAMNKKFADEKLSPQGIDSSSKPEGQNVAADSRRLLFDRVELAGAFGDLGTLLPIVVAMCQAVFSGSCSRHSTDTRTDLP
jgi:hypothetical protein